ncbi:MAG: hypothetical protein GY832_36575, partial [Chloroflexi bacterium]|nr:hypothetical protein [Chloroflexota bacterium]
MIYIDADQYPPLVRWAVFNAIKTRLNCTPLSEQDLDDMLQEAWIAVDRYKDKPRGYQFTAARHAALNYFFKYILARKHSSKAENINQPSIWEKRVSFEETLAENGDETVSHQPPTYNHRPPLPLQGPALRAFLQTLYKSYATGQFKHATARAK